MESATRCRSSADKIAGSSALVAAPAVLDALAAGGRSARQIRPDGVLALQRAAGNAAMVRALAGARDPIRQNGRLPYADTRPRVSAAFSGADPLSVRLRTAGAEGGLASSRGSRASGRGVEPQPMLEPTARPVLARCACGGHAPMGGTCSSCATRGSEEEEFVEPYVVALRRAVAARHTLARGCAAATDGASPKTALGLGYGATMSSREYTEASPAPARDSASHTPAGLEVADQPSDQERTAGNRAVGAMLARARRELPGGPTPTGGSGSSGATSAQTCGPDVTQQVKDVVAATRATFNGWSQEDQELACGALESMDCAGVAWDIVELHNRGWLGGFTGCAQNPGPCQDTVRVDGSCSYGGSVNYVIFGVMCDLCDIWQSTMEDMIWAYKGDTRHWYVPPSRRHAASANYGPSLEWARAGFHGWPTGASSPAGDRPACTDSCPATLSTGSTFNVHWVPSAETETTTDACDAWVKQARDWWSPRIID